MFINGRDDWIRTSGLCVPNAALCQAELHPVVKWATKDDFGLSKLKVIEDLLGTVISFLLRVDTGFECSILP